MDIVTVEHRELLDGDGDVVGYVDPDGVAHEFPFASGPEEPYPIERAEELDEERRAGEQLLVPEDATGMIDEYLTDQ